MLNKIKNKLSKSEPKSLYTPKEQRFIDYLLELPFEKAERHLYNMQVKQCAREVRIIENRPTAYDKLMGFTQKEFPWLAKFNY